MATDNSERMDWNSVYENEGNEFVLLPENTEVQFTVTEFVRTKTQKGDYMAKLTLKGESAKGEVVFLRENLVLLRSCEWKICQFFTCVGLRKYGERGQLRWNDLLGSSGRCRLGIETWTKDGKTYEGNCVKEYLEPEETSNPAIADDDEDPF